MTPGDEASQSGTYPLGRDDCLDPEGRQVGLPLQECRNGGDADWPEVSERGFTPFPCDCLLDPDGGCGTTIEMATMAGSEAEEENEETMKHMDILDEARETCEKRGQDYGHPIVDFTKIARTWDVLFAGQEPGACITPEQVALAMILLKVARITQNEDYYHRDSVLDIIGYAHCLEKCHQAQEDEGGEEEGYLF